MANKILSVKPLEKYELVAVFQNGIVKKYNMKRLFDIFPQFREFEKITGLFQQVKVDMGGYGISWNDKLDISAEDIWVDGILIEDIKEVDIKDRLADRLIKAREMAGMTQKQLSEATGIYQSDISKIERGLANPSLSTLKRLAKGMGMTLSIEFLKKTKGDKL